MKVKDIKHLFNKNSIKILDIEHEKNHPGCGDVGINHEAYQDNDVIEITAHELSFHGGVQILIHV